MKCRALIGAVGGAALLLAACLPAPATALTASPTAPETIPSPALTVEAAPAVVPTPSSAPAFTVAASPTLPAVPATPDPNAGVGVVVFQDPLDGSSAYHWAFESETAVFAILGGQLNAVMKQGGVGPRLRLGPEISVGDQQVRVTARTNLCYARDEYGLIFRARPAPGETYEGYVFKLNCAGQARVEQLRGEGGLTLVDWTPSAAVVPGAPAENVFMIWAAGRQFHFYINDRYLFSAADSSFPAGFYGFYLRDRTQGGASVSFSNLVAREVKAP